MAAANARCAETQRRVEPYRRGPRRDARTGRTLRQGGRPGRHCGRLPDGASRAVALCRGWRRHSCWGTGARRGAELETALPWRRVPLAAAGGGWSRHAVRGRCDTKLHASRHHQRWVVPVLAPGGGREGAGASGCDGAGDFNAGGSREPKFEAARDSFAKVRIAPPAERRRSRHWCCEQDSMLSQGCVFTNQRAARAVPTYLGLRPPRSYWAGARHA
eukprot:SAG11_NODE_3518_length_2396_cov_3.103178_2_plen_217_part_00